MSEDSVKKLPTALEYLQRCFELVRAGRTDLTRVDLVLTGISFQQGHASLRPARNGEDMWNGKVYNGCMKGRCEYYPHIDLSHPDLRAVCAEFRVSQIAEVEQAVSDFVSGYLRQHPPYLMPGNQVVTALGEHMGMHLAGLPEWVKDTQPRKMELRAGCFIDPATEEGKALAAIINYETAVAYEQNSAQQLQNAQAASQQAQAQLAECRTAVEAVTLP